MRRYALLPLCATAPLVALALLLPAALDPLHPVQRAPALFWLCILLASLAPAVTVFTARAGIPDAAERARVLTAGGVAALVGVLATAFASMTLAQALLVRGGGAWFLIAASAAMVSISASVLAAFPRSRAAWGVLAGETVIALVTRALFAAPAAPDEFLRHTMTVAPGWGRTSLAMLAARSAVRDREAEKYEKTLHALDTRVASMIDDGSFAPPYVAWGDDARLIRAWLQLKISVAPGISAEQAAAAHRIAAEERMLFAESPASALEPFTLGGVLREDALALTHGLDLEEPLAIRLSAAFGALESFATEVRDPAGEERAKAILRGLFEKNGLDRSDPLYLFTFSIERRRLVEALDGPGFIAYFDALATGDWPEHLAASFKKEADFVREHPEENHQPVMLLLLARFLTDQDPALGRAAYKDLLTRFPASSVASIARKEMASEAGS